MTAAEDRATGQTRIDPALVAALYKEHGEELRAFLTGVLRDRDQAEEALQASFAKTVEAGHTARQESLKGWLFRVAYHEALALRRKRKRQQDSLQKLSHAPRKAVGTPEEDVARRELVAEVRAALNLLPAEQREIVCERIYHQKTFAVIAEERQLPLGTVLTRMRLAMQKLRDHLNRGHSG